ncbi:Retrotransposon polyprotein [Penicillium coprophilum]|uniref:Retrotransposon polyprotein n=1 Tax=Penicillium coprophilum TaxID=36646 RepID=UPI0023A38EB3|nr:Retrotransposon polyprotein [Penicillium coprophilum]KAJ5174102.1 Retrotransposon polyprotein [Penicillium coprophilum]
MNRNNLIGYPYNDSAYTCKGYTQYLEYGRIASVIYYDELYTIHRSVSGLDREILSGGVTEETYLENIKFNILAIRNYDIVLAIKQALDMSDQELLEYMLVKSEKLYITDSEPRILEEYKDY